jgi:HAD superfamily hydrolase (TIGR01509 family)
MRKDGCDLKRLIIFDFDGVIADSEVLANAVLAEMVSDLGVQTTLEDAYDRYMGRRFAEVVATIESDVRRPLPDDFAINLQDRLVRRFRESLKPVDGAREFLDSIVALPKCIASTSSPDRLQSSLEILGLGAAFGPHVYSASMVARGKPYPDIFLYAAHQVGVPPAQAIVMEDSASGVEAGVAAGMTVIGVLAASHIRPGTRDLLFGAGAHYVVDTFGEAKGIVSDLVAPGPGWTTR